MPLFLKNIKTFFKKFDLFGQPILLSFKGETLYKTWSGGIFTIILVSTIIAFSFEAIISLILRDNVKVSYSQVYENDPPKIELSANRGFNLAFGYSLDYLNDPSKKYFDIQVINVKATRLDNGTRITAKEELKFRLCNQSDFPDDYDFLKNGNKNYLCLEKNQTMILSGKYFGTILEYTQFYIKRCKNTTTKQDCATPEETDDLLKKTFYFNFLFTNKILNLQNHSSRIISYIDSEVFFMIDPKKYKQADIFFQKNSISYDDHLWFYQNEVSNEITYLNFREQSSETMREDVAIFYFRSNYLLGNYVASSEKITFMFSRLGGLISMIYSFLEIFIKPFARRKLLISLSNYLYKFISDDKNDKKKVYTTTSKNIITIDQKRGINFDLTVNTLFESNKGLEAINGNMKEVPAEKINESNILEKIKTYLSKYSKFEYSVFGFLFVRCRKRKKIVDTNKVNKIHDHQILVKALKKMNNDMDIVELLKKHKEFERFKNLYFKNNERTLFEFFPKPVISLNGEKAMNVKKQRTSKAKLKFLKSSYRPSNDFLKKMYFFKDSPDKIEALTYVEVFKAYNSILSQPNISENERRLISFIKEPLDAIFQNSSLNSIN